MSRKDHPRFQWNRSKSQFVYGTADEPADRKQTQYTRTIGQPEGRQPVTSPERVRHNPTASHVELSWGPEDEHKWETGRWVVPEGKVDRPVVTAHPSNSRVQLGDGSWFSTSRGTTKDVHQGLQATGERAHSYKDKYANRERPYDNGRRDEPGGEARANLWVSMTRQSYPQHATNKPQAGPKTGFRSRVLLGEETTAQKVEQRQRAATAEDIRKDKARRERRKLVEPATYEGFSMVGLNYDHDAPSDFYRTHTMAAYPPRQVGPTKPLPHTRTQSQFKLGGTAAVAVDPKDIYETSYVRSHSPVKGRRGEEEFEDGQHSPPGQRYTYTPLRYASQRISEGMMVGDEALSGGSTNRFMTRHREAFAPPSEREHAVSPRGMGAEPPPYSVRMAADKTRASFSLKMSEEVAAAHEKPSTSYANNFVQHKVPEKPVLPCRYSSAQVTALNKRYNVGDGVPGSTSYSDTFTSPRRSDYAKRAPVHKTFSNFQIL